MNRELNKIKVYEKYKNLINSGLIVAFNVYLGMLVISYLLGVSSLVRDADKVAYRKTFLPSALFSIFGVAIALFVARILLFAVCDHIIEMCYRNMYLSNKVIDSDEYDDKEYDDELVEVDPDNDDQDD